MKIFTCLYSHEDLFIKVFQCIYLQMRLVTNALLLNHINILRTSVFANEASTILQIFARINFARRMGERRARRLNENNEQEIFERRLLLMRTET